MIGVPLLRGALGSISAIPQLPRRLLQNTDTMRVPFPVIRPQTVTFRELNFGFCNTILHFLISTSECKYCRRA
jgi:hypothetical protein